MLRLCEKKILKAAQEFSSKEQKLVKEEVLKENEGHLPNGTAETPQVVEQ